MRGASPKSKHSSFAKMFDRTLPPAQCLFGPDKLNRVMPVREDPPQTGHRYHGHPLYGLADGVNAGGIARLGPPAPVERYRSRRRENRQGLHVTTWLGLQRPDVREHSFQGSVDAGKGFPVGSTDEVDDQHTVGFQDTPR